MNRNIGSIELPLRALRVMGLYTKKYSNLPAVFSTGYVIAAIFLGATQLIQCVQFQQNIFEYCEILELVISLVMFIAKLLLLQVETHSILKVISYFDSFWKIDILSGKKKEEMESMMTSGMKFQQIFFIMTMLASFTVPFFPLFGRVTPLGIWKFKTEGLLYTLTVITQIVIIPIIGTTVFVYSSIFLACCGELIMQTRMLCMYLEQFDITANSHANDLRFCIEHHVFIERFWRRLQESYSLPLAIDYITLTTVFCARLYAIWESANLHSALHYFQTCFSIMCILMVYFVPSDHVHFEIQKIAISLYRSPWHHAIPDMRNTFMIIMQRSNYQVPFYAGGLLEINSKAGINVLKISWSVCTLLRILKGKG